MSNYTMTMKQMVEYYSWNQGTTVSDKIEIARPQIFDFDYPIFDETYRSVLETHFIRKFYMREIGSETEELFKFNLETWMNINMPYFNQLFLSEKITFDPLVNSSVSANHTNTKNASNTQDTTANGTSSETGSNNNTTTDFNRDIESDNPDERLQLQTDGTNSVIEYASNISETNNNGTSNTTSNSSTTNNNTINVTNTITDTETYVQSRTGKIGVQTYSKMLMEYRDSLIRIENKLFNEMQELFMLVY